MADRSGMGPLLIGIGVLLLCTGAQWAVSVTIKAAVGSNVTLVPVYSGDPSEINWKLDGNKLVDMELQSLNTRFYRFQGRATIALNGTLTIRGVTKEDSKQNDRYLEYKAEALVNNTYQYTYVTLIVLDCPDKPTISNESTPEQIILQCKSSTPEVTYEWRNETTTLSKGQSYTANRTKEAVTLTCVVDNEVCRNNASITIPPVSRGRLHWCVIVSIIVILVGFLIIVVQLWIYDDRVVCIFIPCLRGENKTETDERKEDTPLMEKDTGGSFSCGSVALNVSPKEDVHRMDFCKNNVLHFVVTPGEHVDGQPSRIERLYRPVDQMDPEKPENYTAEVLSNEDQHEVPRMEKDGIVIIDPEGDSVEVIVPDTENVVTWKIGGDTHYEWKICDVKLQSNKITLEPGALTIDNLEPGDSGIYQVDVHSTEGCITKNKFNLEVTGPVSKCQDKRKITLKVVKTCDPPENGHPEMEPISSVTFHPFKLTNMAAITWMKNGELLVDRQTPQHEDRINLAENGDLQLRHVTSADKGAYTVQCEGLTPEQEFCLV